MENNEELNQQIPDHPPTDPVTDNPLEQEFDKDDNFVIRIPHINDRFETIKEIGEGKYGSVRKCRDKVTGQIVAVKKVLTPENKKFDFPQTTIREVRLLRELRHPNIIELKFVVQTEDSEKKFYLVFDYCEYDLYALLCNKLLDTPHIKSIMKQFLIVLQYCAGQNVIHRDLKPANMFITKKTVLKLGDFGLARKIKLDKARYSETIITQWYRPPEILTHLKSYNYKTEVDIWSAGCILYEMVTGKPLFKAKVHQVAKESDRFQLEVICSICGPLPPIYSTQETGKLFESPKKDHVSNLKSYLESEFKDHPDFTSLIPLLLQMINLNPKERISAEDALNDPFFREIDSRYTPSVLPEIKAEETHQKDISDAKNSKRPSSQDHLNEFRPKKILPPAGHL